MSYTHGTKQLIRQATDSDFTEATSFSKSNDGKPERKQRSKDTEKRVRLLKKKSILLS